MDKTCASADEAVKDVFDGATVMVGGFGLCGNPENLLAALARKGTRNLTIIANNCGVDGKGLGVLLEAGQIKKMISSYIGENKRCEKMFLEGTLDVELCPQGTLAERIRLGGAGVPAFFTPTGYGTIRGEGKEVRDFGGRKYILETTLRADFALVKAWRGDRWGNLVFRKTAMNFNPLMATAGEKTLAEVESLVELGQIAPAEVHTPSIFVQQILQGKNYVKPIERRTTRPRPGSSAAEASAAAVKEAR